MLRKTYEWVHRRSPAGLRGRLVRAAFALGGKPTVGVRPPTGFTFPGGRRGCLVLVADFELAWAWRFAIDGAAAWREIAALERENVPDLLAILEERRIPITWATVGHLMLDGCSRDPESGRLHDTMPRPPHFSNRVWRFETGDWFDSDPGSDTAHEPLWYAPDLVRAIRGSPAGHEIACHTFSHIDMSDSRCPDEVAEADVAECVRLARERGINLDSFVFPAGTYGHQAVLARWGFVTYRQRGPFDLSFPHLDQSGLVVLPSSSGLGDEGYGWSADYWLRRLRKYLLKAIDSGTVCVFWFHPSIDRWFLETVLRPLLDSAAKLASEGDLWIATMSQCARHCLPSLREAAGG